MRGLEVRVLAAESELLDDFLVLGRLGGLQVVEEFATLVHELHEPATRGMVALVRAEVLTACRVLTHFRIVEGFGHVSARVAGGDRILITPRKALGLVSEAELVELDPDGRQVAGDQDTAEDHEPAGQRRHGCRPR